MSQSPPTVGTQLLVLLAQGMILLPAGVGMLLDVPDFPWVLGVISVVVFLTIAYVLTRNVVRLWRLPVERIGPRTAAWIGLLAAWFALVASGPLIEGTAHAKPIGAAGALLAGSLLVVAARAASLVRHRGPSRPFSEVS